MILALWMAIVPAAHASDVVTAAKVVGLKSGAAVELRPSTLDGQGGIGLVQPQAKQGEVGSVDCLMVDAPAWQGLAGFFGRVASGAVPTQAEFPGLTGGAACRVDAAFGKTPSTQKVLTIQVRRFDSGGSQVQLASTSISRRESADLAAGLSVLGSAAVGVVAVARPALDAPGGTDACAANGGDPAETAVRILYRLKGWRTEGDPGFKADVAALSAATAGGKAADEVVVAASTDRRLRPGALGDSLGM